MDEKELNNNTKYLELTQKEITKMKFICNAIDDGWKVKKYVERLGVNTNPTLEKSGSRLPKESAA